MERRGWQKEVVDTGFIVFYKEYKNENIRINLGVFGINIAYYEGYDDYMEIDETSFYKITNYYQKIQLQDLPQIVFSERIKDMKMLIG